jgi:hypothetical protein
MALKNLFGKKSEYFLELDEAKGTGSATTAPKAEPTPDPADAPAAAKVEAPKTEAAPAPKAPAAKAPAKPAPAAKKSEPVLAPAAAPAKPAPAKPAEPVGGFATQYLMPSTGPRRRPGPNMKTFLDMASQMGNK